MSVFTYIWHVDDVVHNKLNLPSNYKERLLLITTQIFRVWWLCKLSSLFVEMLNKILIYWRYFLQEPKKSIPPKERLSCFGTCERISHTTGTLYFTTFRLSIARGGITVGRLPRLLNYPPPLCGGFTPKFPSKFFLKSLLVILQTKMQF